MICIVVYFAFWFVIIGVESFQYAVPNGKRDSVLHWACTVTNTTWIVISSPHVPRIAP